MAGLVWFDWRTEAAGEDACQTAAANGLGQADEAVKNHRLDVGVVDK